MKLKYVLALIFIGLSISFCLFIGFDYAKYLREEKGDLINNNIITVGTLAIRFDTNEKINFENVAPGGYIVKKFSVENLGEEEILYSIDIIDVFNEFSKPEDVVYTISGKNVDVNVDETEFPVGTKTIVENVSIAPGRDNLQEYTLTVKYLKKDYDQSENENKKIEATIRVNTKTPAKTGLFKNRIIEDNGGIDAIESKPTPNFANISTTNDGMFAINDYSGKSYYFRGAVLNNNVTFAGYYWKIIRINGDGSVRLIYNGETKDAIETDTQINKNTFNILNDNNAYVGYKYGEAASTEYEKEHANNTDSIIKLMLDNWYFEHLSAYKDNIANSIFCNDRSMAAERTPVNNTALGYGSEITYYKAYERLNLSYSPSVTCEKTNDQFTLKTGTTGNKTLDYPVGLITADEVVLAGAAYNKSNFEYYLNTGTEFWTMTPSFYANSLANGYFVTATGSIITSNVTLSYGIRPIISLNANIEVKQGDGTLNNPYVIE